MYDAPEYIIKLKVQYTKLQALSQVSSFKQLNKINFYHYLKLLTF